MANLTITIDDTLLRLARLKALQQGTSVNAVLRHYLEAWAGNADDRQRATRRLLEIAARGSGTFDEPRWTREDLHER